MKEPEFYGCGLMLVVLFVVSVVAVLIVAGAMIGAWYVFLQQ